MTALSPGARVPAADAAPARRRAAALPEAVLGLIGAGAAAVVALWWHDTLPIHGAGDWLTNAGRVTGLLAGYGVVVLVALMARLPPLEQRIGADRLARWHAAGGRYVVGLVAAHALLIIWGYAVTAHVNVLSQAWTLEVSYPDVLAATAGGLLLIGVAVTSARAARRRLRYETWYYLHFYTYLAVALAFSHQFADGAEFLADTAARVAWSVFYAGTGAAIVWYRFAVPARQAARHRLRVAAVHPEVPGIVSLVITGDRVSELRAQPGQFFRWRFLTKDLWWASLPYSLSAAPSGDLLRITSKSVGSHSAAVAALKPGTRVLAEGPYGALTGTARARQKVLLVAGGIGIAPVRAMLEGVPARPGDITLIYRVSDEADVVFGEELRALGRERGAKVYVLAGTRAELGSDPFNPGNLAANVPGLSAHEVYVCGPPGMTAAATRALRGAGVPGRAIHCESFEF